MPLNSEVISLSKTNPRYFKAISSWVAKRGEYAFNWTPQCNFAMVFINSILYFYVAFHLSFDNLIITSFIHYCPILIKPKIEKKRDCRNSPSFFNTTLVSKKISIYSLHNRIQLPNNVVFDLFLFFQ